GHVPAAATAGGVVDVQIDGAAAPDGAAVDQRNDHTRQQQAGNLRQRPRRTVEKLLVHRPVPREMTEQRRTDRADQVGYRRPRTAQDPSGGEVNKGDQRRPRKRRRKLLTKGRPARYQGGIHADLRLCLLRNTIGRSAWW